ncbi:MAG: Uma2 family endonuclease [Acidobacteriota bacterium]|nr:Uma2 family endonuclease [Acidobacteriota bacterium]
MATASLIPVQEYLSTVYRPDCDYIEGQVQERNLGESSHATLAFILAKILDANRIAWNLRVIPEVRVQVAAQRFRVPDITVLRRSDPSQDIVSTPPLICIEVLSPEDRISRMQERINDYQRMGVEHVWLIDPITRDAWIAQPDGSHQHISTEFTVLGSPIRISLAEVFAELDDRLTPA